MYIRFVFCRDYYTEWMEDKNFIKHTVLQTKKGEK